MSARTLPDGTLTRSEAAQILGVTETRVSRLLNDGQLQRATGRLDGRSWRHEVEALAAARTARRVARQLEAQRRDAEPAPRPLPVPPPDQEATFEELMLAAEWTAENPGPFVDTQGAADILGVTPQYVGRLAFRGACRGCLRGAQEVSPRGCTDERSSRSSPGPAICARVGFAH
jgi:hypothetical protein